MKPKSFIFYGIAIASVIVLFKVVTVYGENNIKARPNINGRYRLIGAKIRECMSDKPIVLTIQQSGVYLNGDLSDGETKSTSAIKEKLPLKGKWESDRLQLSGFIPAYHICPKGLPVASLSEELSVDIQASVENRKLAGTSPKNIPIVGQINISKVNDKLNFTTEPYAVNSKPDSSPH